MSTPIIDGHHTETNEWNYQLVKRNSKNGLLRVKSFGWDHSASRSSIGTARKTSLPVTVFVSRTTTTTTTSRSMMLCPSQFFTLNHRSHPNAASRQILFRNNRRSIRFFRWTFSQKHYGLRLQKWLTLSINRQGQPLLSSLSHPRKGEKWNFGGSTQRGVALGCHNTFAKIHWKYSYWPSCIISVVNFINTCKSCRLQKSPVSKPLAFMQPIPVFLAFTVILLRLTMMSQSLWETTGEVQTFRLKLIHIQVLTMNFALQYNSRCTKIARKLLKNGIPHCQSECFIAKPGILE